ncbi:MAG: PAS domain S-box protein [Spirochaetales bacterium]|nr:PAS domain S-box protein [Spirochaetales bacterium]MCF7938385.1 PAS domain S-box protein [Spirochaetales bacterium]
MLNTVQNFDTIFDNINDAVFVHDLDGKILEVNASACSLLGYTREELLDLRPQDIVAPEYREGIPERFEHIQKSGSFLFEVVLRRKDGAGIPVEISSKPITINNISCIISTIRDISARKKAEKELRQTSALLQNITDNMFDLVSLTDLEGNFTFVGKSHRILGYELEYLIGKNVLEFVHPEDLPRIKTQFEDFLGAAEAFRKVEYRYRCTDGSYIWLETLGRKLFDDNGKTRELIFSSRDISENKAYIENLRESEERYRYIFNNSAVSLWEEDISAVRKAIEDLKEQGVQDFENYLEQNPEEVANLVKEIRVLEVNDAALQLHGAETREQLRGSLGKTFAYSETSLNLLKQGLVAIAQNHRKVSGETQIQTLNGTVRDIMLHMYLPLEQSRKKTALISEYDITSLKQAIQEKQELMNELNHRVKNNLLMVSSLIHLKDDALGPNIDLSDIDRQITAIRLVHEKLYKTDAITQISMPGYIEEILDAVFSFYQGKVNLDTNIDEVAFHAKKAVPTGLIINEIATNALKHGFSPDKGARFSASLEEDKDNSVCILTLSNTGHPFPADIDIHRPQTLGLQLTLSLVEQLGGSIELKTEPETTFTISIPDYAIA